MENLNNNNSKPLPTEPSRLGAVSSRFFDSNGVELKEGDVFEYTSKKWKSKARIVSKNGNLGTIIMERDMPDRFIELEKYLKRHYVTKVS
jgi:hypothetical protein